jgi:hypothetical protein
MRLWTLHPRHLDARGLVALWREGLLARAVLEGRTRGYRNHPQLLRFREHQDPVAAVTAYLQAVLAESRARDYRFDATKLPGSSPDVAPIEETDGQLRYEWRHLMAKLEVRDPERRARLAECRQPDAHPLFAIVPGDVRAWEKVPSAGAGVADQSVPG